MTWCICSIIFIHGLTGNRVESWKAKGAEISWPEGLLPTIVPNTRICTYGYDAQVVGAPGQISQNNIQGHAVNFLNALAGLRDEDGTVGNRRFHKG
jgi:hypothetical protein